MAVVSFLGKVAAFLLIFTTNVLADNHSLSASDKLFKEATDLVKSKEYEKALKIFEQLANSNEHDAQYNLAILLKAGKGKTKNYTDALYWSFLSKLGEIPEANDLVDDLIDLLPEKTVEEIRQKVKTQLENNVESGGKESIMHLGRFFLDVVTEKEYASAYKWFTVGAALGLNQAIALRDDVEEELTPEQIVEEQENAEKLFRSFIEQLEKVLDEENNS
jgi:TPR repeat protein